MRVLLVEDEQKIADFTERVLTAEGYKVTHAADGDSGEQYALSGNFDLILLDVMLPKKSGLQILKAIRERFEQLPVILLTARSEIEDKVQGLDLGANDYITKPFSLHELLARVRAHLRTIKKADGSVIEIGDLRLDTTLRKAYQKEQEIDLTTREFELLLYLMNNPNRALTRAEILSAVWGYGHDPGTNVVEVYIRYIRSKLEKTSGRTQIETVRSVGYKLVT